MTIDIMEKGHHDGTDFERSGDGGGGIDSVGSSRRNVVPVPDQFQYCNHWY
jgi:hypothetical protein